MVTEKVLTNEEIIAIGQQARAIESGENGYILPVTFARAIEQAVLQSTERVRMAKSNDTTENLDFDPDVAITLAERTLNVEITEPLAEDIVQFSRKLYEIYTQKKLL